MTNSIMLDPTAELNPVEKQILPRLGSLSGATIGLLDISKPRGKEFLDEVEKHLIEMGATVNRYMTVSYTHLRAHET